MLRIVLAARGLSVLCLIGFFAGNLQASHNISSVTNVRDEFPPAKDDRREVPDVADSLKEVCKDPGKAICARSKAITSAADKEKNQKQRESAVDASLTASEVTIESLGDSDGRDWVAKYRRYLLSMKETTQELNRKRIDGLAKSVRNEIVKAIDRDPNLSKKREMKSKLGEVQVLNYVDFAIQNPSKEIMTEFLLTCGSDGLSFNGVFSKDAKLGSPSILLCPAYFSKRATAGMIRRVLGHEFGHSIDSAFFREEYAKMLGCYREKIDWYNKNFDREIVADYWSVESMVSTLIDETPENVLDFGARAFANYCLNSDRVARLSTPKSVKELAATHAKDGPSHPEREKRIAEIFGRNPRVRKLMGCTETSALLPACTTAGLAR